jgi:hypothetical protein
MLQFKFLGTFCHPDKVDSTIDDIRSNYTDVNKVFVLDIGCDEYILTYNTTQFSVKNNRLQTIILNRKKQFNTIYTINAINHILKDSKPLDIDWSLYNNRILLVRNNSSYVAETKLIKIFHIKSL